MILDVGCGSRLFGDIGVDVGYKVLASDSGFYTKANVFASAEYLPFKDDSFEVVHFLGLLHHLHNPFQAWKEMVRVSKDIVIGEEPSVWNPQAKKDPAHTFKGFTRKGLIRICNNDVKHLRVSYYIPNLWKRSINFQIIGLKYHAG